LFAGARSHNQLRPTLNVFRARSHNQLRPTLNVSGSSMLGRAVKFPVFVAPFDRS
jgi:hypothetical protein